MSITITESTELGTPYECPMCRRLFYFENDYVKHKCIAKSRKLNLSRKIINLEEIKVRRQRKKVNWGQ